MKLTQISDMHVNAGAELKNLNTRLTKWRRLEDFGKFAEKCGKQSLV
jgi:hypothetical protein